MNEKKKPENLWKKLILSERSPKIFLHIDDSTPPWLAVQEVLSCCLLFEHRSCTVTVLGWQQHKQSHMFTYCTYKKKKMSVSYSFFSAINTAQAHFAPRAFDTVWADGLNETRQGFSNSQDRKTGHTASYCASSPPQGPWSPCSASGHSWWIWECSPFCYLWTADANAPSIMTSAGICGWNDRGDSLMTPGGLHVVKIACWQARNRKRTWFMNKR